MVAYSFNNRFEVAIREGWKTQTIRAPRARHAREGEMLQLFCGMRTKVCRKIVQDVRCSAVMAVGIRFSANGEIESIVTDGVPVRDLNAFAVMDGFCDVEDMGAFWRASHPSIAHFIPVLFTGVLIEWAAPRSELAV